MIPQIKLFGDHELCDADGAPVRLPTRKSWALLAYLVQSNGREIPREELAALLWPRSAEHQARASLRQELAVLKRTLGQAGLDMVRAGKDAVRFTDAGNLADTTAFGAHIAGGTPEALLAAANIYRGDFLASLKVRSTPFEEWAWLEREQLRTQAVAALTTLLQIAEADGDPDDTIASANRLLKADFTQELAYRSLMRSRYRQGRRAEALQQFDRCRDILRRELDTEPSQETLDLAESIRHQAQPLPVHAPSAGQRPNVTAQRCTATVLCITLEGAAGLSPDFDPERIAVAQKALHRRVHQVASDFGGRMASSDDDRALAVFFDPGAGDLNDELAVRAALAITAHPLPEDTQDRQLLSAGVARGDVLVQAPRGGGAAHVTGVAVHFAVMLAQGAKGREVRIPDAVKDHLNHAFNTTETAFGQSNAAAPGSIFVVEGDTLPPNRLEAARLLNRLAPLVGREEALGVLQAAWRAAQTGPARVVALSGVPGVGKSRLIHSFLRSALAEAPAIFAFAGSQMHRQIPLHPVATALRAFLLGPGGTTGPETQADLDALLSKLGLATAEATSPLAQLLIDPHSDADTTTAFARDDIFQAIAAVLRATARRRPLILVADDLHWLDPTTLMFLDHFTRDASDLPCLVLLAARPGTEPDWLGPDRAQSVYLPPLTRAQGITMVSGVLPANLPSAARNDLIARADGIPLVIEELADAITRSAVPDSGVLHSASPESLQGALTSLVDHLPDDLREIAQIASVFGYMVTDTDLQAATGLSAEGLFARVRRLQDSGLLFRIDRGGGNVFTFKHGLTREAVYATLQPARRAAFHLRAAEALEHRPGSPPAQPDVLGQHFAASGQPEKAIDYYHLAGRRSARMLAHQEAAMQFRAALRLLPELSDTNLRTDLEIKLLLALGPEMQAARGFSNDDVAKVLSRARTLVSSLDGSDRFERLQPVLWGLWGYHILRADLAPAADFRDEFIALAKMAGDPASQVATAYMAGVMQFYRGGLAAAQTHFTTARQRYRAADGKTISRLYTLDAGIGALGYQAWIAALQGRSDLASDRATQLAVEASEGANTVTRIMAQVFAAGTHAFLGNADRCLDFAETAEVAATAPGLEQWRGQAMMQIGRARWALGDPDGLAILQRGYDIYRASGAALAAPYANAWIAEAQLANGDIEAARDALSEAQTKVEATGVRYFEAELHRLQGIALAQGSGDDRTLAQQAFEAALQTARASGAALLHLRASISFAEHLRAGRHNAAALRVLDDALQGHPVDGSAEARRADDLRRALLSPA